jgi:hypothetical protein
MIPKSGNRFSEKIMLKQKVNWSTAAQRSIVASRPDGGSAQNCRPGWAAPR